MNHELQPAAGFLRNKMLCIRGLPLMPEKYYSFYMADVPEGLPRALIGDFVQNYLEEHMPMFFDKVHIQYAVVPLPASRGGARGQSFEKGAGRTRQVSIVVCPKEQLAAEYPKKRRFLIPQLVLSQAFLQGSKALHGFYFALIHDHVHLMVYRHYALVHCESVSLRGKVPSTSRIDFKKVLISECARLVKKQALRRGGEGESLHVLCEGAYKAAFEELAEALGMEKRVIMRSFDALDRLPKHAVFAVPQERTSAPLRYGLAALLGVLCAFAAFDAYNAPRRKAYTRARLALAVQSKQLTEVHARLVSMRSIEEKKTKENLYALLIKLMGAVDSSFVLERISLQKTGSQYSVLMTARARSALAVVEGLKNAQVFTSVSLEQVKQNQAVEYFTLKGGL